MKKAGIYSLLILVVTVLFTACSQKNVEMDKGLAKKNVEVIKKEEPVVESTQNTISNSEATLDNIDNSNLEEKKLDDTLAQKAEDGYYYIIDGKKVLIENIYFAFDKYRLTPEMIEKTKSNAEKLAGIKPTTKIKIEGNCDEWGTDEYNYALGLKRVKATKDALVADGINAQAISLVSFGESNPVCTEKNRKCWQKNRRAEHKLLP